MSKEILDQLLDHDYDGIKEYDNPLPGWWKFLWYASMVFSAIYFVWFHILGKPGVLDSYESDMAAFEASKPKSVQTLGGDALFALTSDSERVGAGREIFVSKCAACHTNDGGGLIGPNLCDNYWKNSDGSPDGVMHTIKKGVIEKGMIAWEPLLTAEELENVAAFVLTLRGTTPENPKAPEGDLYE